MEGIQTNDRVDERFQKITSKGKECVYSKGLQFVVNEVAITIKVIFGGVNYLMVLIGCRK